MAHVMGEWEQLVRVIAAEPGAARWADPRTIVVAWSADAERVVWRSAAARRWRGLTQGAPDGPILPGETRARLRALGGGLAPRSGFRLERLRLADTRLSSPLTVACRIVAGPEGDALLTAFLDGPKGSVSVPAEPAETSLSEPDEVRAGASGAAATVGPEPPSRARRAVRFVWAADVEGRFTSVSPELAEVVGADAADIVGRRWREMAGRLVVDDDDLAAAFAGHRPWRKRRARWRAPASGLAIPVELSGTPIRTGSEAAGYRGFGRAFPDEAAPPPPGALAPDWRRPASDESTRNAVRPASSAAPFSSAMGAAAALTGTAGETMFDVFRAWFGPQPAWPDSKPSGPPQAEGAGAARPDPPACPAVEAPGLTGSERGALHEIARALETGVAARPDLPPEGRLSAGIVRHPSASRPAEGDPARVLDQIPVAFLVIRHGTPIFANRHLLDLAGQADLPGLVATSGVESVLERAGDGDADTVSLALRHSGGEPILLNARFATVDWGDLPATVAVFVPGVGHPASQDERQHEVAAGGARIEASAFALALVSDGIVTLDGSARILSLSRAAERLFGFAEGDVIGDSLTTLILPDDHRAAFAALDAVRGGTPGGVAEAEVRTRMRFRQNLTLQMKVARHPGDRDDLVFSAAFRDLSAAKALEETLRETRRVAQQAGEQRTEFLARVSHEVRTPLTAITGFAELMLEERFGALENERYKGYVRDIQKSGEHVLSLVNDLLDLAKVTSGHGDLQPSRVDLNATVQLCVGLSTPLAGRERTIIRTSFRPDLPAVFADERSLRQIVLNVLSNAIRFTGAGGQVIVSTAIGSRGEVVLSVRDTGPGMTDDEIEAALTPFRQVPSTRRGDGTGLGLPLSKALVEANGGAFGVTSAREMGTLIEVRLPVATDEAVAAE